jgi:hypothetical protein
MSNKAMVWLLCAGAVWVARGEMPEMFVYEGYYASNGVPYTGHAYVELRLYSNFWEEAPALTVTSEAEVVHGYYSVLVKGADSNELARVLHGGEVYVDSLINGHCENQRTLLVPKAFALRAAGLTKGCVKSDMLASGSVGRAHLAVGAVGSAQIEEEAVSGWHIQEGSIELRDLDLEELDARYLRKAGDVCGGALTNTAGFWGNGYGLTNLSPQALHAATSFVRRTGDTITGSFAVRGRMCVDMPAATSTNNPALTRLILMNRTPSWREFYWFVHVGAWGEVSGVKPNAFELWEYSGDNPSGSRPRWRVLPSGSSTNVPTEVIVGPQGNVGLGCWPTGTAKLAVNGPVEAAGFAGDGSGLTNLSPQALDAATSFVRKTGGPIVGSVRISSDLTVMGSTYLYYVPPQGGISMGPFTNR